MAFEHYVRSGDKLLRCGYTTGSCAALAAAGAGPAAAYRHRAGKNFPCSHLRA